MHSTPKKIKGFTILEVIIVLSLVGIISAIGIPQFNSWNKDRVVRAEAERVRDIVTSITSQVRTIAKNHEREVKAASKSARKKRKSGNRQPSGFVKPAVISDELAGFLGKYKGTEMARTEVTREINSYIRAQKLQDPANGRRILADAKLRKLLRLGKNDELTYFNLQKYMSPHFAKKGKSVSA